MNINYKLGILFAIIISYIIILIIYITSNDEYNYLFIVSGILLSTFIAYLIKKKYKIREKYII